MRVMLCRLLGVPLPQAGLGHGLGLVLGGGCPRPWEKQGLRLGLGVLALAPRGCPCPCGGRVGDAEPQVGVVLCPLLGVSMSQVGLAWVGWPMG